MGPFNILQCCSRRDEVIGVSSGSARDERARLRGGGAEGSGTAAGCQNVQHRLISLRCHHQESGPEHLRRGRPFAGVRRFGCAVSASSQTFPSLAITLSRPFNCTPAPPSPLTQYHHLTVVGSPLLRLPHLMSQPTRPLIDRRRTSSRDRGVLHSSSRTSSPRHSPAPSPVGSPTHQAGQHMLRSALKHNHVHPEPRAFDEADFNPEAPCQPPAIEVQPATGGSSLPDSGLGPSTSTSGTSLGPQYSRRVGFDTFESGADLEEKGASTGGGTGELRRRRSGWLGESRFGC